MQNFSLTYLAVIALAALGIDDAESVVNAIVVLVTAAVALWGRYRAGGVNAFGLKK